MDDLYPASIAGIDILLLDRGTDDAFQKAIVRHEYPGRDGALLEDMGQKARTVKATACFFGEDYERHQEILDLLDVSDTYEFIHPVYGVLVGSLESVNVRHSDREQYAEVEFSFVEDLIGSTEESLSDVADDVAGIAEAAFLDSLTEQALQLSRDIADASLAFSNATALRAFTGQMETLIGAAGAIMVSVAQPANTLLSTVSFATDVPGRTIGALAQAVERYSALYESVRTAPAQFVRSFRNGMLELQAALPQRSTVAAKQTAIDLVLKHARIAGAARLGLELTYLYRDDETARKAYKTAEQTKSFDRLGNFIGAEAPDPIMTVTDIENTLADARTDIQDALTDDREMKSLAALADALLSHVNRIKIGREKIAVVQVDGIIPLHLLCLQRGLPYNMAERILALNPGIKNPSFVSGEVKVYVR